MIARRVAGVLLALSMSYINVVEADLACATHHRHRSPMAMDGMTSQAHVLPAATDNAAGQHSPCETPVQVDCCQALASCSLQLGFRTEMSLLRVDDASAGALAAAAAAPLSLIVPPDPPPPRA